MFPVFFREKPLISIHLQLHLNSNQAGCDPSFLTLMEPFILCDSKRAKIVSQKRLVNASHYLLSYAITYVNKFVSSNHKQIIGEIPKEGIQMHYV